MRLDKMLSDSGYGSRKEIKKIIESRIVFVNGKRVNDGAFQVDENNDLIEIGGKKVLYKKYYYYVMNKPAGYITAREDREKKTVMDVLPDWVIKKDLSPVGRLDIDTEGVLIFTNDGELAHEMMSPKKHVKKVYYCRLEKEINEFDIEKLKQGVVIDGYMTKEAEVEVISKTEINLTISEGKYHQVKKMLEAVNNKVIYLKRIKFGNIELGNLQIGEVKEVSKEELKD